MNTIYYGCKTEQQTDICYPCHSRSDVDRAKSLMRSEFEGIYWPNESRPPLLIKVYFEASLEIYQRMTIIRLLAYSYESNLAERPKYSEDTK